MTEGGVVLTRSGRRRELPQRWTSQALDNVRDAPWDTSSLAHRPQRTAAPLPATSIPCTRPDVLCAADQDASARALQTRGRTWGRHGDRLRRRDSETEQRERSAKAIRTEAMAKTESRRVREYESDVPEASKRRAVDAEDAASREGLVDETVSGDGPTEMDVSAVADAYSHPYYDATSGDGLHEQRVTAARFEELDDFKRRGVYAKVPVAEALGRTGKKRLTMTTTARSTGRAS